MHVERRFAAAHLVVIERGKIIVDQAEGVDEFDRRARRQAALARCAGGATGVPRQGRAQPLPATQKRITNCSDQIRRMIKCRRKPVEVSLDGRGTGERWIGSGGGVRRAVAGGAQPPVS
jgi:hypothetical protein